jgi:hypothetical protein
MNVHLLHGLNALLMRVATRRYFESTRPRIEGLGRLLGITGSFEWVG